MGREWSQDWQVVAEALGNAGVQEQDLSAVAVTIGPGLSMCLRGMLTRETVFENSSFPIPLARQVLFVRGSLPACLAGFRLCSIVPLFFSQPVLFLYLHGHSGCK